MVQDETHRWHGMETGHAIASTGATHVGGLSAAISYGWTTSVEHHVTVYGAKRVPDPEVVDVVRIRCVQPGFPLEASVGISLRRDGSGSVFLSSDRLRAAVECLLDDEVLDVDAWQEILLGAGRDGIDPRGIVRHADTICPSASQVIRQRIASLLT